MVSNSLDPDQARRFVGPDLGPNCFAKVVSRRLYEIDKLSRIVLMYQQGQHTNIILYNIHILVLSFTDEGGS